jgi:hypothetical protein
MATTIFDAYEKIMAEKRTYKARQLQTLEFRCSSCKAKLAAIFHADGGFCTECGQTTAHPDVEYH